MLLSTSIVLIPDGSAIIQLAIFLSALGILTTFVLRPFVHIRDMRVAATIDAVAEAARLQERTAEQLAHYRRQIEDIRQEGAAIKEQLRQEGYAKATTIMDRAKKSALERLDAAKAQLKTEAETARRLLAGNAEEFARAIAERILERSLAAEQRLQPRIEDTLGRRTT